MAEDEMDYALMKEKIHKLLDAESGKDRIKRMYSLTEYNTFSPELSYIIRGAYVSAAFGGFIGALAAMNQAKQNFLRSNEATPFDSQFIARRKLTDSMSLVGIRALVSQGFKIGSFTATYMLLTLTAANYRNKITIWEHVAAGAFIGSVARFNFGPKGMLAAGFLGGTLGLFAGGIFVTSMWLSGTSFEELRYWQHEYYNEQFMMKRNQSKKKAENQNTV